MSVSSACRYSEPASSTPARNAPSAIDMPTAAMSCAMPTTSSSANAVNTSRRPVLGDRCAAAAASGSGRQHDHRRPPPPPPCAAPSQPPPTRRDPPAPAAARARPAGWPRRPGRARIANDACCPRATSSSVALAHRLHRDRGRRQRQRQPRDERAPARGGPRPARPRRARSRTRRAAARRRRRPRAAWHQRRFGSSSRPIEEQHQHDAELGEVQDGLHVAHEPSPHGPIGAAGDQVAEHRAEPKRLASGTKTTAAPR